MTGTLHTSGIPRISVLMTVYNAAPFLRASIDSLIAQHLPDWELVVVENGSTDESASILAGYADPRIHVVSVVENIGRTPALRRAFDCARGEYIAVLDADDVSHPERLWRQAEFLDKHPEAVLVGSWSQYIDKTGNVFDVWQPPTEEAELHDCLGWVNPIVHSSAMYRRKAALAVGGYPERFSFAQDFALILALAQQGKLAVIDDYLCQLRVLPGSITRSCRYRLVVAREGVELLWQAAKSLPLSAKARRLNRRAVAIGEIKYGMATMMDKSIFPGVRIVARGLARDPTALWMNARVRKCLGLSNKTFCADR